MSDTAMMAFWFGALSASSLLVGATIGIFYRPPSRLLAALMAFGGGALLSALAFELVEEAHHRAGFVPLAVGAIMGGLTFVALNRIVNQKGGFLRKSATINRHLRAKKKEAAESILKNRGRSQKPS